MPNERNEAAFISLFKETCRRGLGHSLTTPLSEAESKVLSAAIFEQTGLVVGGKSLKNYSLYVLKSAEGKQENPSVATLDTLARFILGAPYSDEAQRKSNEGHYPYWFRYRSQHAADASATPELSVPTPPTVVRLPALKRFILPVVVVLLIGLGLWWGRRLLPAAPGDFAEPFTSAAPDSLRARGWTVQHLDTAWWRKSAARPGYLTLYTLPGDNWPAAATAPLKNLLVHRVAAGCFSAEIHFRNFFPAHNWQQAGLLLSENETFTGKVIRVSLAYNNYFGGYARPPEILIQGISSTEAAGGSKPEEFAHITLFTLRQPGDSLVASNLRQSALKIEKRGRHFRFLYTAGALESFAFKEAARGDFALEPRYVAVFATQGAAPSSHISPVQVDFVSLTKLPCEDGE
ncbi:hypothetical protein [uncultured Hymenobacter sp.]|uniref:hypothetical protein n=1 Tax=uncultured Hymenobacter sp. TaxID=170016 RepID=UPI0035C9D637